MNQNDEQERDVHASTLSIHSHKREIGCSSSDEQPKQPRKHRKPTHVVRREEKEALVQEIDALQTQLAALKYRAMFPDDPRLQSQNHCELSNSMLRDAIQCQHLAIATVQGVLAGYLSRQCLSPIKTVIRLGKDRISRKKTLAGLKPTKLKEGRRYLLERSRYLDPIKLYSEEDRFETDNGDFYTLRFDRVIIHGASSMRAVFDAFIFHILNVEISLTEALGNITVREDDDSGDSNISHHRLVTTTPFGVRVETNNVVFSEFDSTCYNGLGSGLIVSDFVDEDDLHPYRPTERLRRDTGAIVLVTPHIRKVTTRFGDQEELLVVLTRWGLNKLHHTDLNVPEDVNRNLREVSGRWTDEMLKSVEKIISKKHQTEVNVYSSYSNVVL